MLQLLPKEYRCFIGGYCDGDGDIFRLSGLAFTAPPPLAPLRPLRNRDITMIKVGVVEDYGATEGNRPGMPVYLRVNPGNKNTTFVGWNGQNITVDRMRFYRVIDEAKRATILKERLAQFEAWKTESLKGYWEEYTAWKISRIGWEVSTAVRLARRRDPTVAWSEEAENQETPYNFWCLHPVRYIKDVIVNRAEIFAARFKLPLNHSLRDETRGACQFKKERLLKEEERKNRTRALHGRAAAEAAAKIRGVRERKEELMMLNVKKRGMVQRETKRILWINRSKARAAQEEAGMNRPARGGQYGYRRDGGRGHDHEWTRRR